MKGIRIMLIDDEPPFLEEMERLIIEYGKDCTVISKALSGRQALLQLESIEPDIIFTDVRMPVMNGIDFAKTVAGLKKDAYIVVISGYPSFEYAREAFRADVFDYLLKPIDPVMVKNLLERLVPLVLEKQYTKLESIFKRHLFTDEKYQKSSTHSCYSILMAKAPISIPVDEESYSMDFLKIKRELRGQLRVFLRNNEDLWIYYSDICGIVALIGLYSYREGSIREMAGAMKEFFTKLGMPVSIGISERVDSVCELQKTYKFLEECFPKHIVIGKTCLVKLSRNHNSKEGLNYIFDDTKIKRMIDSGNWKGFKSEIISMFGTWEDIGYPIYLVAKNLKQIIYVFEISLPAKSDRTVMIDKGIDELINLSRSFGELMESFWDLISGIYLSLEDSARTLKASELFRRMEEYIRKNIGSPLSLLDMSETFGVSQSHISNLFRSRTGTPYIKHVTNLRMDRAKKLLEDPVLSVKEVSKIVGYEDNHYFSRVFKTQTGISPTEYKTEKSEHSGIT